jgi:chorismate mutase
MGKEEIKQKLFELRKDVDQIDRQLVDLLDRRSARSLEIGSLKNNLGMELHSPEREDQIFKNILNTNLKNISEESLKRIYSLIIEESLRIQKSAKGNDD